MEVSKGCLSLGGMGIERKADPRPALPILPPPSEGAVGKSCGRAGGAKTLRSIVNRRFAPIHGREEPGLKRSFLPSLT
jgi:hypothetical protein